MRILCSLFLGCLVMSVAQAGPIPSVPDGSGEDGFGNFSLIVPADANPGPGDQGNPPDSAKDDTPNAGDLGPGNGSVNLEKIGPSSTVPEPASMGLIGGGLIGLALLRRRGSKIAATATPSRIAG